MIRIYEVEIHPWATDTRRQEEIDLPVCTIIGVRCDDRGHTRLLVRESAPFVPGDGPIRLAYRMNGEQFEEDGLIYVGTVKWWPGSVHVFWDTRARRSDR